MNVKSKSESRLSKGCICNTSGVVKGMKLKHSRYVKGYIELNLNAIFLSKMNIHYYQQISRTLIEEKLQQIIKSNLKNDLLDIFSFIMFLNTTIAESFRNK